MAKKTQGNVHITAQSSLLEILSRLSDDKVTELIIHDPAIIYYGNIVDTKYQHSQHHAKMIRARLRGVGGLLLEMKTLNNEITDFASLLSDEHFDLFIQAYKNLGNYDEKTRLMINPATAESVGMHTKELCELWIIHCKRM